MTGLTLFLVFIVLMLAGVPIGAALGLGGIVAIALANADTQWWGLLAAPQNMQAGLAKYPLLALPMFVLVGSIFDFLINAVNGLLLMSVIIAVIGIVNTLSLSILERRRELGLLRAVGMTDRRVQRMVRLESMLIAGLGTITGLLLGLFVAWGLIHAIDRLADADIAFSVPGTRLVLVLVLGVSLGVLASLIPARRSTKLDVLDAIQST